MVTAATTGGLSIGSLFFVSVLNGVATTPCSTFTGADGKATTTCVAVINSKGELTTKDVDVRSALDRLQYATDGSLKVASQGTSSISGNVNVSSGHINVDNFAATQAVNGTVGVNNFPATQAVNGTVGVNNLPTDQQIHGNVTVTNFPAATGSGGVTRIDLPVHTGVASGAVTFFDNVDVSSCRAFTIAAALSANDWPDIGALNIRDIGFGKIFSVDLKRLDAPGQVEWAFPVLPFSSEPFYGTNVQIAVRNRANVSSDVTASVFCQH